MATKVSNDSVPRSIEQRGNISHYCLVTKVQNITRWKTEEIRVVAAMTYLEVPTISLFPQGPKGCDEEKHSKVSELRSDKLIWMSSNGHGTKERI